MHINGDIEDNRSVNLKWTINPSKIKKPTLLYGKPADVKPPEGYTIWNRTKRHCFTPDGENCLYLNLKN